MDHQQASLVVSKMVPELAMIAECAFCIFTTILYIPVCALGIAIGSQKVSCFLQLPLFILEHGPIKEAIIVYLSNNTLKLI
jgi:uncharacterized membrane protein